MTIKLHTEKVFLPARPQAMAFLKGKIDSLLSKCKIYISHLLLPTLPTASTPDFKKNSLQRKCSSSFEKKRGIPLISLVNPS